MNSDKVNCLPEKSSILPLSISPPRGPQPLWKTRKININCQHEKPRELFINFVCLFVCLFILTNVCFYDNHDIVSLCFEPSHSCCSILKKILRGPHTASVACRRGLWVMQVNNLTSDDFWPRYITFDPMNIWWFPYYINKPSLVQIRLQLFKWGHFHIFSPSYNLTLDDLDLINKWEFPCCIYDPTLVEIYQSMGKLEPNVNLFSQQQTTSQQQQQQQ